MSGTFPGKIRAESRFEIFTAMKLQVDSKISTLTMTVINGMGLEEVSLTTSVNRIFL
jgi:hypothetical protein